MKSSSRTIIQTREMQISARCIDYTLPLRALASVYSPNLCPISCERSHTHKRSSPLRRPPLTVSIDHHQQEGGGVNGIDCACWPTLLMMSTSLAYLLAPNDRLDCCGIRPAMRRIIRASRTLALDNHRTLAETPASLWSGSVAKA